MVLLFCCTTLGADVKRSFKRFFRRIAPMPDTDTEEVKVSEYVNEVYEKESA